MIIPKKEFNIYPKTEENIHAVLSYYFDQFLLYDKKDGVDYLMKNDILSMNQIEFIARKLSEAWVQIFRDLSTEKTTSFANIMHIGILSLTLPESKWQYSRSNQIRPKIREFIEFVKKTEIDFEYLAINN